MATPLFGMVKVHVGEIPESKLRKAFKGNAVRLTNADLNGDRVMLLHPHTAKMVEAAKKKSTGVNIHILPVEAFSDIAYHQHVGEGMHGGSLWSWLKNKAWPWIKTNWKPVIKPILSTIADRVAPALGPEGVAGREALRTVTGIGMPHEGSALRVKKTRLVKGSAEARIQMAKLRAMRKGKKGGNVGDAGSFSMP